MAGVSPCQMKEHEGLGADSPHGEQLSTPMSHELYVESSAILEQRISCLEKELAAERKLRIDAIDNAELELCNAAAHTETVQARYVSELETLNESYTATVRLAANKKMKNEAIAERIEYLTNAMVDRIDMVTSLEHALGRTSKALSRARTDERLLVDRVRNLEEQGLRMSVLVKRVADTQRMAMNTNKELVLSMQKNETLESELDQQRAFLSTCLSERDILQSTARNQESELKTVQAESKAALAKAKVEHADVVKKLQTSVHDLQCRLKSQGDDATSKRAFLEQELDGAISKSKVHELENEKLRGDNMRLEKSLCDHRDKIAKLEARAEEQQRKLQMSHDESRAALEEAAQENVKRVALLENSARDVKRVAEAEKRSAEEAQASTLKKMESVKLRLDESECERARLEARSTALIEDIKTLQESNKRMEVAAEQRELRITALEQSTENSDTCQSLRDKIVALEEDRALQQDDLNATAAYCQKLQKNNAEHLRRIEKFESLERARALSETKSSATTEANVALQQKVEASERKCEDLKKECKIKDEAFEELRRQAIVQATKIADDAAAQRRMAEKLSTSREMEVQCVALKNAVEEHSERIIHLERRESMLLSAVRKGKATFERLQLRMERLRDENHAFSQRILRYRSCAAKLQQQINHSSGIESEEKRLTTIWQLDLLRDYCERLERRQEFLVGRIDSLDKETVPTDKSPQRSRLQSDIIGHRTTLKSEESETVGPSLVTVNSRSACTSSTHDAILRRCTSIEEESDGLELRLRRASHVPILSHSGRSSKVILTSSHSPLRIVTCAACEWGFEPAAPTSVASTSSILTSREIPNGEASQQRLFLGPLPQAEKEEQVISQESEDSEMSIQPAECHSVSLAEKVIFISGGVDIPCARARQPVNRAPGFNVDHREIDSLNCKACTEATLLRQRRIVCVVPGVNVATPRNETIDPAITTGKTYPTSTLEPRSAISHHCDAGEIPYGRRREEPQAAICCNPHHDTVTAPQLRGACVTADADLHLLRQRSIVCLPSFINILSSSQDLSHCSIAGFDVRSSRTENSFAVLLSWDFAPAVFGTTSAATELQECAEDALGEQSAQESESFSRLDEVSSGRSNGETSASSFSSRDSLQSADCHDRSDASEVDACLDTTSSRKYHRPDALQTALSSELPESFPTEQNEEKLAVAKHGQEKQYSEVELHVYEDQILRLLKGHEELELRVSNYQKELEIVQETAATATMERNAYLSQAEKLAVELGRMSKECDMINRTLVWMREAHLDHMEGVSSTDSVLVLQLISSEMERLKARHVDSPSEMERSSQPGLKTHRTFLSRIASDPEDNDSGVDSSPVTVANSPGGWSPFGFGRQARKKAPGPEALPREKSAKQDAVWNDKPDWNVSDDYTEIAL